MPDVKTTHTPAEAVPKERLRELRKLIDDFELWKCGSDADGYNISADHLAMELARRTPEPTAVNPAKWWAVHSVFGSHIGLWRDENVAREVLCEYPGGKITALVEYPFDTLPSEAPEPTAMSEDTVERVAISFHDITSDPDTVDWDKQLSGYRTRMRKTVREVLRAHALTKDAPVDQTQS